MEYTTIIIEVADTVTQVLAPLAIAGIASAIPGIAKGIGSLFGGRKRRREERRAQRARGQRMAQFEAMEFTNPYKDIENSFEDLRVATEAAQMQQQTAQQVAAQGLATGQQAGLSPAALAQTQQNLINRTNQAIRADVARQEAANERLSAQGAMKADQLRGQGENVRQQLEMGKRSALLGMANQDLAAATRARAQAKADLVGGIGALGSAAFSAFGGSNPNAPANEIVGTGFADNLGLATNIGLGDASKFNRFLQGKANDKNTQYFGSVLGALGRTGF